MHTVQKILREAWEVPETLPDWPGERRCPRFAGPLAVASSYLLPAQRVPACLREDGLREDLAMAALHSGDRLSVWPALFSYPKRIASAAYRRSMRAWISSLRISGSLPVIWQQPSLAVAAFCPCPVRRQEEEGELLMIVRPLRGWKAVHSTTGSADLAIQGVADRRDERGVPRLIHFWVSWADWPQVIRRHRLFYCPIPYRPPSIQQLSPRFSQAVLSRLCPYVRPPGSLPCSLSGV